MLARVPAHPTALAAWFALLVLGLLAGPLAGRAEAAQVPAKLAAQLHVKLLSYDKALKTRVSGAVKIGVVVAPGNAESRRDAGEMLAAYQALAKNATVQGLKLEAVTVDLGADATKALQAAGVSVAYVSSGLSARVGALAGAAKSLEIPTLSRSRADCEAGLAVAIVPKDNRPAIVVNLPAAKASGMQLSPSVLRLAEVLR